MSYNYLPLDRKWLNFQQVKNLLDYDQQVSITFDAHERILKCCSYLDSKINNDTLLSSNIIGINPLQNITQPEQSQEDLIKNYACGSGEEVPVDIVKLMLMLKIKSLTFGFSGVQINTVKRLMEMYNDEVYPVVYAHGSSAVIGDFVPLSHLCLPLIGLGTVNFKGKKNSSLAVLSNLTRQPLQLQKNEAQALLGGNQFTTACGMFALKKMDKLLKIADLIAAMSFDAFGGNIEPFLSKISFLRNQKGELGTAAAITAFLAGSEIQKQDKQSIEPLLLSVTQVHGSAKDAFEYVLNIFLQEINLPCSPYIFPDEDLVISCGNLSCQSLTLALDFLCLAINEISAISVQRTAQFLKVPFKQSSLLDKFPWLLTSQNTAAAIAAENNLLSTPASTQKVTAGTKCIQMINNAEKILAIELLAASKLIYLKNPLQTSPYLQEVLNNFNREVFVTEHSLFYEEVVKASEFVSSYNL